MCALEISGLNVDMAAVMHPHVCASIVWLTAISQTVFCTIVFGCERKANKFSFLSSFLLL